MKKKCFFFLLALLPLVAYADAVNIGGIYYNLSATSPYTAEVTASPSLYSGEIIIPATVRYQSKDYSVTSIGVEAFADCSGLTSVTIPDGVTTIGNYAFANSGLTSIFIPKSVTDIGITDNAVHGCDALTSIVVAPENTKYDSRENCNAVIYTNTNRLLIGCKETIIPNTVESIGSYAFSFIQSLTSITIPNSVRSINSRAFNLCTSLTDVYCNAIDIPTTSSGLPFETETYNNATLHVPAESFANYKNDNKWGRFLKIESSISYTLNNFGKGTFCSEYDLDFTNVSGIRAYIACGFNPTTGIVFIMRVNEVPANTGIMIKGTPGTYTIPLKSTNMFYSNMFKGVLEAMTVPATEEGYKNYVLLNGSQGVLFYGSDGTSTVKANQAYLRIPLSAVGANTRGFVGMSEENTTGIVAPESMSQEENEVFYNLNGQRVVMPNKGLYIKNGKKVFIHNIK